MIEMSSQLLGALMLSISAQEGAGDADWELVSVRDEHAMIASLNFGDNVLALRCQRGVLDFIVTGLPETGATSRRVRVTVGAGEAEEEGWSTFSGSATASEPGRMARRLRAGGPLNLRLEPIEAGADGEPAQPPRRYVFPTPPSAGAIDQVLTRCDEPLQDDRDEIPRVASSVITWLDLPSPSYPETRTAMEARAGEFRLMCIVQPEGRLKDCEAIREFPARAGFAEAAVTSVRRARLQPPPAEAVGKIAIFNIRFRFTS